MFFSRRTYSTASLVEYTARKNITLLYFDLPHMLWWVKDTVEHDHLIVLLTDQIQILDNTTMQMRTKGDFSQLLIPLPDEPWREKVRKYLKFSRDMGQIPCKSSPCRRIPVRHRWPWSTKRYWSQLCCRQMPSLAIGCAGLEWLTYWVLRRRLRSIPRSGNSRLYGAFAA